MKIFYVIAFAVLIAFQSVTFTSCTRASNQSQLRRKEKLAKKKEHEARKKARGYRKKGINGQHDMIYGM